jgi:hypothetical protein
MAQLRDPSHDSIQGLIEMASLRAFLESIGSAVGPELILSPGKDLFHYTDLNGLLGIIQNGDLWLTHSRYSNDEEEMAHGQRVAQEAVVDALKQAAGDQPRTEYVQQLKTLIDEPSSEGVYICCFCQKDNLLSQWRGYGANGAGVSVQFDSTVFSDWTGADCQHGLMRFWKVFYKPETQRRIIDAAINFAFSFNKGLPSSQLAERAADAIQFFIPTFKNTDFAEEAEWRLIFTPNCQCTIGPVFRVRGSMLVPYYRLQDLSPSPAAMGAIRPPLLIGHITVGPSASKVLNVASVRMLLDRYGYTGVTAEASQTSFRS